MLQVTQGMDAARYALLGSRVAQAHSSLNQPPTENPEWMEPAPWNSKSQMVGLEVPDGEPLALGQRGGESPGLHPK